MKNYYYCIRKYVISYFRKTKENRITQSQVKQFVQSIDQDTTLAESYKRKIISIFKTALIEIIDKTGNE